MSSQDPNHAGWVFKPGGSSDSPKSKTPDAFPEQAPSASKDSVEWTASEYVAHQKQVGWYLGLAAITLAIATLLYFITRDSISTAFVVFAGFVLGVTAARKPRVVAYRVDQGGLSIGQKYYPYSQFKSFVIMQQGPLATVMFMPLKRILPSIDMYIPPENADAIMEVLANNLPLETRTPGVIDTFAHRIRF